MKMGIKFNLKDVVVLGTGIVGGYGGYKLMDAAASRIADTSNLSLIGKIAVKGFTLGYSAACGAMFAGVTFKAIESVCGVNEEKDKGDGIKLEEDFEEESDYVDE